MATTARKTAQPAKTTKVTKKATPAKSTKSTEPKATKVKKSDQREEDRDWTYLADKMPTDLHEGLAKFIVDKTGIEVEDMEAFTKAVQLTAVLRMVYQRSDANKARTTYRALDEAVVAQRSLHMIAAHTDAQTEIAARKERDEAKAQARRDAAKARRTRKTAAPAEAPAQEAAAS